MIATNMLVPVDGSEISERAAAKAIELAQLTNSKLTFLYVANLNPLAINVGLSDSIIQSIKHAGEEILQHAAGMVPNGIEVKCLQETGSPGVVILETAKIEGCDLIVMGSRGLGVVKGVFLGSVSQYVVEQSVCPVMVVK